MEQKALTAREQKVWESFQRLFANVLPRVAREVEEVSGLSEAEFALLLHLNARDGQVLLQQEVANSLGWDKSRLSHLLTRMQKRMLVERISLGSKGTTVAPTQAGKEALNLALPAQGAAVRHLLIKRLTLDEALTLQELAEKTSIPNLGERTLQQP